MSQYNFRISALFHKIAVITLGIITVLVILLGLFMVSERNNITKTIETNFKESMNYGHDVSYIITGAEATLKEMSAIIGENYNTDDASKPEKLQFFLDKTDRIIRASIDNKSYYQGVWFQINPYIAKNSASYFSWYFRDKVQNVIKFEETSSRLMTPESDPYYYNAVKAGKMVISGIYKDRDSQVDLVTLSEPIYIHEMLIGVAGIDFSIEDIKGIFTKAKEKHGDLNLYLYNSQNVFITGTNEPSDMIKESIVKYLSDKGNQQYIWCNNSLVFEILMPQKSFSLVAELPSEVIYSNLKQVFNITFALIGFLILMLIVVLIDRYKLFNYAKKISDKWNVISGLMDSIPDKIALRDKQGVYLSCNESYAKFFNKTKVDISETTVHQIIPKLFADEIAKEDQEVISSKKTIEKEQEFSGEKLTYLDSIKAPLYDSENELIGIVNISRDITDRKKKEMELLDAKKKADALAMDKTNFLRNMTNEILTPLNGIAGFLELLNDTRLDTEQADYVKEARASSDDLLNLIKQILEFTKIQDGQIMLDKAKINIRAAIGEIISANVQAAEKRGVIFNAKITHSTPAYIVADKLRLRQVLNILVGNAIKFTGTGDEVLLETSAVNKGNNKAKITFKVSDTGSGISSEDIDKIKEAFERYDLETTKKNGGIGLGLTIANRLIKIMDSEINIISEKGKGTIFSFSIEEDIGQEDQYANHIEKDALKGIALLIIERNKTTSDIAKYYLEKYGCSVQSAFNEMEGIEFFKSGKKFSLVIIGSDLNCFDAAKEIIKIRPVSMILLCDSYKTAEAIQAKGRGFASIVRKPALPDEIVDAVKKALRNDKITSDITNRERVSSNKTNDLKILVVEDNETHAKMILKSLVNLGIPATDSVVSGNDAIRLCKVNAYDLIIMDCQLPLMDGYETTRRIRNSGMNIQKTAIIGLTSYNLAGEREKCMNSGMDEFLAKPIDPSELIEKLNSLKIYTTDSSYKQAAHLKIAQSIADSTGLKLENAIIALSEYKSALPKLISEISSAIQKKEFKAIFAPSNSIKEISPFFGMERLSKLAEDINNAAGTGNEKACVKYLEEIRNCVKLLL
ncbi:MAG TPA: hypothetical protein DD381_02220 [Lentisphaeria bacterium]|nr:MAG: hypothetical protein A2X47_08815 [Lentisphaerae bacterium GWF2_38_69]HBM15152.1 hypothetical protein [Lentisphaeria bacterium]